MGGINKVLAQDWAMGVNDFTLKEGIILNPNYFPENGEDEYWQGDLKLTYKIENNSMKNYLKLNGFLRPTSGEFVTREFKVTGDETYNVEKAGDILYVARSLSCPVQEVVSDSEFKVTASVADVLTRYDSRFTSNALGNELICRVTSSGDVYYKAFSITDENVSLRDIKDWETGETGSAFEIATLAVGDLFELINAYDVLQEGLELTTGYPTLGYVIKHVESSGSWIKFNKYDKPNKSAIDKVLITYYPLSDFQPEYPYWSYMDRYGTYDVEENIDFPITTAQEEEIIQNFKKYLEPLITFTLVTKRPTILRRGQEIAFSASRYPTGIFKVIDNVINRETEKGSNNNRGNVIQKITFANYTDNWARMIGNLKNRNDIQKAKIAEYKKQKSFFSFKLKVTWGNLSASIEAPGVPENLIIADYGADYITISWDLESLASEYHVIISENSDLSDPIETGTAYDNDYTFESLAETTTYYMGVKAVNYVGESDYATIDETTKTTTEYIIYASNKTTRSYLYKTNYAKTFDTKLTAQTTYLEGEWVAGQIRSDGAYIAYDGDIATSNNQIVLYDTVNNNVINMTGNNSYIYRYPCFKPNDNDFVYFSNQSIGNGEVWYSDIATQTDVVLRSSTSIELRHIIFNEDGSRLLINCRNPTGSIWTISYVLTSNYNGSLIQLVNRGTNAIYEMAWNHDYTKLCFASLVGSYTQLFECNADGTGLTQRTTGNNNKRCPVYSPDGTKILFRYENGPDFEIWEADTTYDMSGYFENQAVWLDTSGNQTESPIDWKVIIS